METNLEFLDFTKDYRIELKNWKINENGDLVRTTKFHYTITKDRLKEEDWLSHMAGKLNNEEYGEFVRAYFKACEMAGIKELNVHIYGMDSSCKFIDEQQG